MQIYSRLQCVRLTHSDSTTRILSSRWSIILSRNCSSYMGRRQARSPPATDSDPKRRRFSTSEVSQQPIMTRRAFPVKKKSDADRASITLTEVEARLSSLLLDVASFIKENPVSAKEIDNGTPVPDDIRAEPLQLRFTGGWVRDKLLGVPSHDIDVALSNMTGFQFGRRLQEYLEIDANVEKHGLTDDPKKAGSLAKIAANPEKSKHLETVTTRIMGLDIDLVNLRKETYTEDSRNPTMEFGTPLEDALRRDATINAMFYNLGEGAVEDLTEKGLDDLDEGVIRTPLEPYETFTDDPLRVLRLIRFASRLGYNIEDDALQAMKASKIKSALIHKITKERIWTELEKMLRGPDPRNALAYVHDLGLYTTIFCDMTPSPEYEPDSSNWPAVCDCLQSFLDGPKPIKPTLASVTMIDEETRFQAWWVASFVPYANGPEMPALKSGKASPPLAALVARDGLKCPTKLSDLLSHCVTNLQDIIKWSEMTDAPRDKLGMAIRHWGASWKLQTLFAMLYQVENDPSRQQANVARFNKFIDRVYNLDLEHIIEFRPLIDGKSLATALDVPTGPWTKFALDIMVAWQLRNPDVTDPAEVLKEIRGSGVIEAHAAPIAKPKSKQSANGQKTKNKPAAKGELTPALISYFLKDVLRPLFSQAKNPELTAAGRRKIGVSTANPKGSEHFDIDDDTKLWKNEQSTVFGLVGWICDHITEEIVSSEWGLLVPPILNMADDHDATYRCKGAELLGKLIQRASPTHLARTGLAPVFEETLMANLSFLPSLTPETETIQIYDSTLPALLVLADKLASIKTTDKSSSAQEPKVQLLDSIMRKGILHAYRHCGEHVRITELLLTHLPNHVAAMGIDSVKHLKDILPMISNVLSDPFGAIYPSMLEKAAQSLISIILVAWPRIAFWRAEILNGVTMCWIRLGEEDETKEGDKVRASLQKVVEVLGLACTKTGQIGELRADASMLVGADARLRPLFPFTIEGSEFVGGHDLEEETAQRRTLS